MTRHPLLFVHPGLHGVAVYERQMAAAVQRRRPGAVIVEPDAWAAVDPDAPAHVHFTDRLWGSSPAEAARAFVELASARPVSVTLHDLPQASDGPASLERRRAAYRAVAAHARAVAVNSDHERLLLAENDVWDGDAHVIALPVTVGGVTRPLRTDGSVGVLGYFYPGKGHDEAAIAAAEAGAVDFTVLGRASDGHAADLEAFVARAGSLGVRVEVTGWLDDDEMMRRASEVTVPVIAHRHVSASGSLASWIGWGRRPVAVRNRYIDEMSALRPGTVDAVDDDALAAAVARAAARPDTTWHGQTRVAASEGDAADAYERWWDGVSW